jgi:hypothetical protein
MVSEGETDPHGNLPGVAIQAPQVCDVSPCKELDARSLRGGGGELGNLKKLNLWLHYFA